MNNLVLFHSIAFFLLLVLLLIVKALFLEVEETANEFVVAMLFLFLISVSSCFVFLVLSLENPQ